MKQPGRLLMFWDYDTQWGTDADLARGLSPLPSAGALEFERTDELLELHDTYQVPACFAIVGAAALAGSRPYHDADQVRRVHAAGHEVASHTFRHEWIPGLTGPALAETLRRSRAALEDCIGAAVTTFVPPYNQPFDHPGALSFSRSERLAVRQGRVDLPALCGALAGAGFRFCRVAYRPLHLRIADGLARRPVDWPVRLTRIAGITCCRLNTRGGFATDAMEMVERAARTGGIAVVYGHPHSIRAGDSQDVASLVPFLARVRQLRLDGALMPVLPRDLVDQAAA